MSLLKSLPVGVALPLLTTLLYFQTHPSSSWALGIYKLIGIGNTIETRYYYLLLF